MVGDSRAVQSRMWTASACGFAKCFSEREWGLFERSVAGVELEPVGNTPCSQCLSDSRTAAQDVHKRTKRRSEGGDVAGRCELAKGGFEVRQEEILDKNAI